MYLDRKLWYKRVVAGGRGGDGELVAGLVAEDLVVPVPVDIGGRARHLLHPALQVHTATLLHEELSRARNPRPRV